ncbi:1-acyl-sn-glycerol-3-phosphate acyltransferase [Streptomyces sp. SPB4]|nr:lysophospholipid acyltransferase family protein [Streptomyces sp. SPB4]MDH6537790.1 1-acyl-sn-glycerol-3-phosphate acyltransferase [Streptomyces sp. SPB4]
MSVWLPTAPCTPQACADHPGRAAGIPRAVLRLAAALALFLLAVPAAAPVRMLPVRTRHAVIRAWSAALLRALGIRITVHGAPGGEGGRLIVANHISWLDIPLVTAVLPSRMLAKSEIGAWPVLGALAARAGTLFIERDRIRALPETVATVTRALLAGNRVTVFPEGSTWCGRAQGPFRRAAFQAALDARVPVQPVRLRYRLADGEVAGAPAFVGDDPLTASLWRIARARGVRAEVWLLPRIPPGRHPDRRELAAAARLAVLGEDGPGPGRGREPQPRDARELLAGVPAQQRPSPPAHQPAEPATPPSATERDNAKRPSESVHHWVNSSPASASSFRTPS